MARGAPRRTDHDDGQDHRPTTRAVGEPAPFNHRRAARGAATPGRAACGHRGARGQDVATPHDRRARELRVLDTGTLAVSRSPGRARRYRQRPSAPHPQGRGDAARGVGIAGRGGGQAAQRPPELELPAPRGQPGRGRRARCGTRPRAVVHDRTPADEGARTVSPEEAAARWTRGRRQESRNLRFTRDPQLRVRVRARPVASGLPHRGLHPDPARERRVGRTEDPGDPRRPGSAVLPRAVVLRRERGEPDPRAHPGHPEARAVSRAAQRQRLADARGRDARGARASGHLARHDLARVSGTERQAGGWTRSRAGCSRCSRTSRT